MSFYCPNCHNELKDVNNGYDSLTCDDSLFHCMRYNCFGFSCGNTSCYIAMNRQYNIRYSIDLKLNDRYYNISISNTKVGISECIFTIKKRGNYHRDCISEDIVSIPFNFELNQFNDTNFHKLAERLLNLKAFT